MLHLLNFNLQNHLNQFIQKAKQNHLINKVTKKLKKLY